MENLNLFIDGVTVRNGINPITKESMSFISSHAYGYESENELCKEKIEVKFESEDLIKNYNLDDFKNAIISVKGTIKINPRTNRKKIVVDQIININVSSVKLQKYRDEMTTSSLVSSVFGASRRESNEIIFNHSNCKITLDISDCELNEVTEEELLSIAEKAYTNKEKLIEQISSELVENAWDNDNKEITLDDFKNRVTLLFIDVDTENIYLELNDGGLFYGHRIHANFDYDLKLIDAEI